MGVVRRIGRLFLDALAILPWALAALAVSPTSPARAGGLLRSMTGENGPGTTTPRRWRTQVTALLLLPIGVVALLGVLFATLDEVRVVLVYGLTDRHVTPGTWGGPGLAGAWLVHAGLGVLLFPLFLGVLAALTALARELVVAFLVAFVNQL